MVPRAVVICVLEDTAEAAKLLPNHHSRATGDDE